MSFIQPIPCDSGGGGGSTSCCPNIFTGYCLDDGTPIAITIVNGVQSTWTDLLTGVVTIGAPPAGTGICPSAVVEVQFQPLTCEKDSVTVCQGEAAWIVTAVDLDIRNLNSATDSITVIQGTSPWAVSGTIDLGVATLAALETITVLQGTVPWVVSGTVELGPVSLAALESITVAQGTSPWVVSGTVALDAPTLAALETITVLQGTSPWTVSGTVALDAPTLAALETITVLQGTSPWTVTGTIAPADSVISTLNSTNTPLASGGAFIGTFENTLPFVEGAVMVVTDQISAIDGLRMEQSIDGVAFADVDVYSIPANNGKQYTFALNAKFFRVTYTNGATPQTRFELSTIYRRTAAKPSSHRINDTIITEDDAELVKSVLSGQIPGGSFVNVGAEASGYLHTHDEADYAEDVPSVNGSLGQAVLGVRNDTGAAKTTTDGDYTFFATDAAGRIGVADLGGSITIDGTVTANTNFDYPEDSAHTDGDIGAFVLAVRNDAGTPLAADGEYIPFTTDATGALRVNATFSGTVTVALDCATDSVTICPGADPIIVSGTVDLGATTLAALETITVNQGTSPWVIGDGGGSITVDGTVTSNQGTSPWVIGDGGGSITVDGTVGVTQTTSPWVVSGTVTSNQGTSPWVIGDGGGSITVDGTVAVSGTVAVTQSTSPWVVSGTVTADTNFDYPEDSVHASGDSGAFVLAVRNDAGTPLAANGDYIPFTTDATGALRVNAGATVTQTGRDDTDNQTAVATGLVTSVDRNYVWDSVGGNWDRWTGAVTVSGTVTVNQGTSPWVTSLDAATLAALESITVQNPAGAGAVNIQDGGNSITVDGTVALDAGTLAALESITVQNPGGASAVNIQDGGNSITVDGAVTVSGTVATNSERAEDAGHTSGQIGNFVLGVRNDTAAILTSTDLDYTPLATDSAGRMGISDLGGAISIDDNGGSITVDGTVAATQSGSWSITILNGSGAAAVNIQDGGNSITVDGTVAISGTVTVDTELPTASALADADANPTTSRIGSNLLVFNGTTWDRIRGYGDNADGITVTALGLAGTASRGYIFNGTQWNRARAVPTSDGQLCDQFQGVGLMISPSGGATLSRVREPSVDSMNQTGLIASGNMGWNGSTWDRMQSGTDSTDTQASVSQGVIKTVGRNYIYNGATWDRARTGTALGSTLVNNPTAANLLATVTIDAGSLSALESITVQNPGGASAVNIQDGGNSITVDGTVSISGTVTVDTELPAASALADADPNPTTSRIGADNLVFNGTTWDRVRAGTATGSILVNNPTAANFLATVTIDAGSLAALESITVQNPGGASAVNIQDGGNSITVDGTVAATQSGAWSITVLNGAGAAAVNIQDGGNSITVDGAVTVSGTVTADTNFDYAEDAPHVSGDPGAFVLAVRNDANAVLTNTNGDYSPIAVNSAGAISINDGGNSITVDGTVAVSGTVAVTQSTSPWVVSGTVTVNQGTSPWVTSLDATTLAALESITVQNPGGASAVNIQDGGNSITVDGTVGISGTVAVTQSTSPWVVSGTVASNAERAEDSGHTSGQTGNFVLGVRNDTAAILTSTDLDYTPFATDSAGRIGISDLGGAISIDDNGGSITVDGTVAVSGTVAVTQSTSPWVVSNPTLSVVGGGTEATALRVTIANNSTGVLAVTDNGGSLTVDGTIAATQSGAWSVTNLNGAGAAAVNIQDGGNSITVDGTVAATQSGAWSVTNLNGAGAAAVNIQDGGNSITVDGTVSVTQGTTPWVVSQQPGTITNGAETAVSSTAVQILAANANRKKYFIQNTGTANIRVGTTGVTNTTGARVVPNGTLLFEMPNCPTQAIFAIRENATDSIAFAEEIT